MTALGVPTLPPVSIGSFRHAGTGDCASAIRATTYAVNTKINAPFTDQAIGNSYAHPKLAADAVTSGTMYDHSFLGNEALWDGWFFSSLASRNAAFATVALKDQWSAFIESRSPLLNPRFLAWPDGLSTDQMRDAVFTGAKLRTDAYKTIAARLLLRGGFNVNSTSVEGWTSFLASTRGKKIRKLNRSGNPGGELVDSKGTLFSRTDFVLDGSVEDGSSSSDPHYSGFRDLDDASVRKLAAAIVEQVKLRGPFLNVSEFINRRPGGDPKLSMRGALQAAIDGSGLNDALLADGRPGITQPMDGAFANPDAAGLNSAAGAPGWLMQGDVLDPLGPFVAVRGDTFRIRGYGEARDTAGAVTARAWCEAVVQRVPSYLDPKDDSAVYPPTAQVNLLFGRGYRITGFRWITRPEA
ncbi:MAG: hypothetical protein QM755_02275 [Luteolibacter sp.]